jgi:hypothetical protein
MTGASNGLESAQTTLTNPGPWASGGEEGQFSDRGAGNNGGVLGQGSAGSKSRHVVGFDVTLPVLWCANGAGTGCGRTVGG